MTDPKQFICQFLGIPETDFAEVVINSRMMVDLLQAWDERKPQQENDNSGKLVASYNPETKDWTTKYPNLLNATKE